MMSRKRGMWVNYSDLPRGESQVARIHLGSDTISTCFTIMNEPVLTNGKIGSVSDTVDAVTVEPQTPLTLFARDQA
jgi:hypothetical protein